MMDKSFEEILGSLPISEKIKTALIEKKGELSFYIGLVIDYENMNWTRIKLRASKLNLTEQNIIDIFLEATQWANSILSEK
jgi:EAL and modified HD-GYP domain-containing signal transduction protein